MFGLRKLTFTLPMRLWSMKHRIWLLNNAISIVCLTHWAVVVLVLVESSMRCVFFIWKIEWADLHQVIRLFLIFMLYIMHATYFTILNILCMLRIFDRVCWSCSPPKNCT